MKTRILTFSDSNMAGFSWIWSFYLEDQEEGAYGLSCKQVMADDDEAMTIEPLSGLRSGADVYYALESMLSEAGSSLADYDLASISAKIGKLNKRLAVQFERDHEPTISWDEEQDFYRRVGGGPKVILHGLRPASEVPTPLPPKVQRRPRAK